nr:hypothetical transcript [Hymenolepis microstoma]
MNERTNYPPHTKELIEQIDQMGSCLKKLITATEDYVGISFATKVAGAIQKNKEKITTTDRLGAALEDAAIHSERAAPNFAEMLRKAADVHTQMAEVRKTFNEEVNRTFIEDLKTFQSSTLADAYKAKSALEDARLDLDSYKSKLKNAKDADIKAKCEADVSTEEAEFDKTHKESVEVFEKARDEYGKLGVQLKDLICAEYRY